VGGVEVRRGIALLIPNLGIRWRWMFICTPQLLYCWGKSPWHS